MSSQNTHCSKVEKFLMIWVLLIEIASVTFFFSFLLQVTKASHLCLPGRIIEWLPFDNMHHQWLLLAACFWVIFMFMVASKFITLTFKDPDGRYASWQNGFMASGILLQHCA